MPEYIIGVATHAGKELAPMRRVKCELYDARQLARKMVMDAERTSHIAQYALIAKKMSGGWNKAIGTVERLGTPPFVWMWDPWTQKGGSRQMYDDGTLVEKNYEV